MTKSQKDSYISAFLSFVSFLFYGYRCTVQEDVIKTQSFYQNVWNIKELKSPVLPVVSSLDTDAQLWPEHYLVFRVWLSQHLNEKKGNDPEW